MHRPDSNNVIWLQPSVQGKSSMALGQADYTRTAAALAAMMVRRRLEAGEVLFASGDPADEFYLIEQGVILAEVHACACLCGCARGCVHNESQIAASLPWQALHCQQATPVCGHMHVFIRPRVQVTL